MHIECINNYTYTQYKHVHAHAHTDMYKHQQKSKHTQHNYTHTVLIEAHECTQDTQMDSVLYTQFSLYTCTHVIERDSTAVSDHLVAEDKSSLH